MFPELLEEAAVARFGNESKPSAIDRDARFSLMSAIIAVPDFAPNEEMFAGVAANLRVHRTGSLRLTGRGGLRQNT